MKNTLFILVALLTSLITEAQFIKEKALNVQIGYAITAPYDTWSNAADDGFFAQGELILKAASWVEFRPYAGFIFTNADTNSGEEFSETKAFLLGGKARLRAPIPWIAPYAEIGIGTSIGSFKTYTFFESIDKSGIIYHIPFAFGLELGPDHNVDIGLAYYFQPTVEQFAGAFAIGLTIPLRN
ncbi:hypothetical protein [Allomuricauda sp. NBRC 101325]|uniref:hypothetical protein n=1 Tax=Allomuricauda sp. NBRC 101325 TaxID=1113758 RepID=UPI0024A2EBF9|nr:hypothetical protein [Muricauda sp. NBRC 101325]GLU42614.1 hypothetical protein Musp01_02380 [Muricauda sp. NBRC 101325]